MANKILPNHRQMHENHFCKRAKDLYDSFVSKKPLVFGSTGVSHCRSAAVAIPDLAASIFSAYCSGICIDFHPLLE
jgi:hypothetical protein